MSAVIDAPPADAQVVPDGWRLATLGEIGAYHNGRGFKKSEWKSVGRPIIRIQNLTDPSKPYNYFDGDANPRNEVRDGDLLVSWAATLDVFRWRGPEAVLNQHIFKVESYINPDYHYFLLKAAVDALYAQSHGSGMVHVTRGRFEQVPVLVPALDEQARIVETVEELMAQIAEGERQLESAIHAADNYRAAVLRDSLEGCWDFVPLRDVLTSLRNGIFVSRPVADPPGIPIYRISAVRPMTLDVSDIRFAPTELDKADSYLVQPGDLLFTRYSGNPEYVGACALVPDHAPPALHPDKLIRGVVDRAKADPTFLQFACSGGETWRQIRAGRKTTAGQVGIAGSQLGAVEVPLPPLDVQHEIAAQCETQLAEAKRLREELAQRLDEAQRLRQAVLRDAMAGKLTRS